MDGWLTGLTAQAAANIEHFRHARGITRTELARRCTDAGLPTRRPALTGLLNGDRQTITLQELIVFAQVLDVTVAELVVPLHTGTTIRIRADQEVHAYGAAQQLFGIPATGRIEQSPTYRLLARYTDTARRFSAANTRLITVAHALAIGATVPHLDDARPHPAAELLATEAALSQFLAARSELEDAGVVPPPTDLEWRTVQIEQPPSRLPVLEHAQTSDYPLFVYQLSPGELPQAQLIPHPIPD